MNVRQAQLPEGWEIKQLGELFDVQSSKRVHKKDWKSEGIPFYRAREVVKLAKNGFVENELFISEELFNEFTKDKGAPKEDDIIVSAVGTLGQCYLVQKQDKFYIKDASVLWLSKKSEISSRYIEYSFRAPSIQEQVLDRSMGATVGTLTISRAKNIKIPLPPLPEQQRIVSILDRAFAAIDKAKANAEQNRQNAAALFESYLQGVFDPSARSGQGKGDGWERANLGDVCSLYQGIAINAKTKHALVEKSELPLLRIKDLKNNTEEQYIDPKNFPKNALVNQDDIIYTRTGSLGLVFRGRKGVLHNNSFKVVPNSKLDKDYLFIWLQNPIFKSKILDLALRAAQPDITHKIFKIQEISFPSIGEQQTIVHQLDALRAETQKLEAVYQKKIADLEELKKSILQKAFRGELVEPAGELTQTKHYDLHDESLSLAAEPKSKMRKQDG